MPYINAQDKAQVEARGGVLDAGALTYLLTKAMLDSNPNIEGDLAHKIGSQVGRYVDDHAVGGELRYTHYCTVMGALACTHREFVRRRMLDRQRKGKQPIPGDLQRISQLKEYINHYYARVVAPYEDRKIRENGDVF